MTIFQIFGILFLIVGGIQSLLSGLWVKKYPVTWLFLIMGILFILTGFWMLKL